MIAALLRLNRGNVISGLLTLYLVMTGLLALRRPAPSTRRMDRFAMNGGFAVALLSAGFGLHGLTTVNRMVDAYPAPAFFIFALIAVTLAVKDSRILASRKITRADRLKTYRTHGCCYVHRDGIVVPRPTPGF